MGGRNIRFLMQFTKPGEETPVEIGILEVSPDHLVAIKAGDAAHEAFLADIARRLNERTAFHLPVPPPQGGSPSENWSKVVHRGDEGFVAALIHACRQNYAITLVEIPE